MDELTPRTNSVLFGHDAAETSLFTDYESGKLAHGWLITGPQGIGKATLAYRFARTLLSGEKNIGAEHPVFRRIAAESHMDLLVVEPAFDAKKDEFAREISVEQAREVAQFLAMTPGEGAWRVVIIDSIDALNTNAANAILKILEEPPPQSVILLICHNPAKILPTIRSRCQVMRLKPLIKDHFYRIMEHILPDIDNRELAALAEFSNHAPGVAVALKEQGAISLYEQLLALLVPLPELEMTKLHGFAEQIGGSKVHGNWQLLTRLMLHLLAQTTRQASGDTIEAISMEEQRIVNKLAAMHSARGWAEKWQQASEQFSLAETRHLDYKQVVIAFIHSLASKEGFQLAA